MKNPIRFEEKHTFAMNMERKDIEKLEEIAKKLNITRSELLRIIVKNFLYSYTNQPPYSNLKVIEKLELEKEGK